MNAEHTEEQDPTQDVDKDATMSDDAKQSTTAAPWGAPVEPGAEPTPGETDEDTPEAG